MFFEWNLRTNKNHGKYVSYTAKYNTINEGFEIVIEQNVIVFKTYINDIYIDILLIKSNYYEKKLLFNTSSYV